MNIMEERLEFTTDTTVATQLSDLIILVVGTPSLPTGEANLTYIEKATSDVAIAMNDHKVIAIMVSVETNHRIQGVLKRPILIDGRNMFCSEE
ncbi:hypothetical protein ELR57_20510 [Cohnella sp. AR92]|nr:hypothetical protein ELR57_20510 [Cohnella sp. AR92]